MLRKAITTLFLALLGLVLSSLHYLLPSREITTVTEAVVKGFCSGVSVHSEVIIGFLIFFSALGALISTKRAKLFFSASLLFSILGIFLGIEMRPLSYYLGKKGIEVGLDTSSLKSHLFIQEAIILISLISGVMSLYGIRHSSRIKRLKVNIYTFAITNLVKRKFRALAMGFFLTAMVASLFTFTILWNGINKGVEQSTSKLSAEILVLPEGTKEVFSSEFVKGNLYPVYMESSFEEKVKRVPGVHSTEPQIFFKPVKYFNMGRLSYQYINIVAISDRDTIVRPWIYHSIESTEGIPLIAGWNLKYYPGQKFRADDDIFNVVAILDKTESPYLDNNAFIKIEDAYKLIEDSRITENIEKPISAIFVRVDDPSIIEETAERIESIEGVDALVISEISTISKKEVEGLFSSLLITVILFWMMGILMIALMFMLIINERTKEIGILRALGAGKGYILKEIWLEALIIGICGGIAGIGAGGVFLVLFKGHIAESLRTGFIWLESLDIIKIAIICLLLGIFLPILSSLYPAYRAVEKEPSTYLRD